MKYKFHVPFAFVLTFASAVDLHSMAQSLENQPIVPYDPPQIDKPFSPLTFTLPQASTLPNEQPLIAPSSPKLNSFGNLWGSSGALWGQATDGSPCLISQFNDHTKPANSLGNNCGTSP